MKKLFASLLIIISAGIIPLKGISTLIANSSDFPVMINAIGDQPEKELGKQLCMVVTHEGPFTITIKENELKIEGGVQALILKNTPTTEEWFPGCLFEVINVLPNGGRITLHSLELSLI